MFIELHRDGKRMLVSTEWISRVSEKTEGTCWIYIGDSDEVPFCDESYDEVVGMIRGRGGCE